MDKPTAAIRNLMTRLDTSDSQLFEMLLKVVEGQQEEIDNLRRAIEQQAQRFEGHEAQLSRRVSKLEGVHGA